MLVLGGGLSGLATAWWLAQAGVEVAVWEQDDRAGGKIATRRADGYLTEQGPSLLFNYRPEVAQLLRGCGLEAHKRLPEPAAARHRYLVHDGRLLEVPQRAGALLRSPLWSWRGRLRLLAEPFIARGGHEAETVSEFVRRRLGSEFLDRVMEPFVAGVLAADPDHTHLRAALPRLSAIEERYGSLMVALCARKLCRRAGAPAQSFSFTGGMTALTGALACAPGVTLRTGHRAVALRPTRQGWCVTAQTAGGEKTWEARCVVLSLPAEAAAALLRGGDPELARLLERVEYAPLAAVHLGFDRAAVAHPLAGMGYLVPRREASELTGVQWISSLFPERAPPGKVLLSAYLGGARAAQILEWDDGRCAQTVLAALRRWFGVRAEPERLWVDRHARGLPLYHRAYGDLIGAVEHRLRRWPGLHLAANFVGGISTRDRIVCAHTVAERIRQFLRNARHARVPATTACPVAATGAGARDA